MRGNRDFNQRPPLGDEEAQEMIQKQPVSVSEEQKVFLEFPYYDFELLYHYVVEELGILNPFK